MAIQFSGSVRDGRLNSIETTIGTSAVLKIFTGSPPANCAAADTGTTLATLSLPSDYFNAASSGSMTKLGTWSVTASATNTAGYFRVYNSGVTTCHIQGTVSASGGGGDMIVSTTSFVSGATVTVNTFTLTDANA